MKYLVVAAVAAVATGGIFALRSPGSVARERRVEIPVQVEVPVEVPVPRSAVEVTASPMAERDAQKRGGRPEASFSAPLGAQEKMLFLFERELTLTSDQRRHFVAVLRDRVREIDDVNQQIADAQIFSRSGYSRTIREIRARSYERMAEVLDSMQYRRFGELVREGRLGDAVAITIDPSWTVID